MTEKQQAYIALREAYFKLRTTWGYTDEVKFLMKDLDDAWNQLQEKEQNQLYAHFEQELQLKVSKKRSSALLNSENHK